MANTDHPPTGSADLQDLIGPVWRRKWLLLAIVLLSTGGTYYLASRQPPQYRSSTQVFVAGSQIQDIVDGSPPGGTDRSTQDQATLLLSAPVTQAVLSQLHLRESPAALLRTVTASPVTGLDSISVGATAGSGAEAAAVANAYVQQYIRYSASQLIKHANAAIGVLKGQLRTIPVRSSTAQQRQNYQDTIRQIQVAVAAAPTAANQTQPAVTPGVPFSPKPKRDAAFAFAIALGLGLALVFALDRFDRRIKNIEEVADIYGVPLLSVIPHATNPINVRDGKPSVTAALREPFRSLRTNLQLASLDKPIECIVVASAVAGEGKSTVVTNLALTYRDWGLSVAVVEADMRRPTLSVSWSVSPAPGLISVLTDACDLAEALIDVEVDKPILEYLDRVRPADGKAGAKRAAAAPGTSPRLVLLPSGPCAPNPPAVLAAGKMRQVLGHLTGQFDIVLVDTPPLLAVSDAIPLLAYADGVILVTRVGLTERASGQRAMASARLDSSVNVLGVVANDVTQQLGYGYGYGYGQGYA
jgi:receptor protein-tyrosine kinase